MSVTTSDFLLPHAIGGMRQLDSVFVQLGVGSRISAG
jgi:hypothetical protein